MRITLGYPDPEAERQLLRGRDRGEVLRSLSPCLSARQLLQLQHWVDAVYVSDALLDYLQALLRHSRQLPEFPLGLSPRAGLALLQAAKAWAFMEGRDSVYPDDLRAVLTPVAVHRLRSTTAVLDDENCVRPLLEQVAVP